MIKFDTSRDTLNSFMMPIVADDGADDANVLNYNQLYTARAPKGLHLHVNSYYCANNRDEPLVLDGPILWIRLIVWTVP